MALLDERMLGPASVAIACGPCAFAQPAHGGSRVTLGGDVVLDLCMLYHAALFGGVLAPPPCMLACGAPVCLEPACGFFRRGLLGERCSAFTVFWGHRRAVWIPCRVWGRTVGIWRGTHTLYGVVRR